MLAQRGRSLRAAPAGARGRASAQLPPPSRARRQWRSARPPAGALAVAEQAGTSAALEFGSHSVQGPRGTMEDVLRLERDLAEGFTYACILDGHGGALSAQWLYDELFDAVAPSINASLLADDAEQPISPDLGAGTGGGTAAARELLKAVRWPARAGAALSAAFKKTDARLVEYLRTEFGLEVMGVSGSTALVGLIHPTKAVFASLGDCMAVLCRGGAAVKATQQHRVYGIGPDVLEELARVESTGAWVIDGRVCNVLAVSRAFGDPEIKGPGLNTLLAEGARKGMWTPEFAAAHVFKSDPVIVEPDVTEVRFSPEDEFLLMATDGLWDCMPPADAVQYARKQFRNGKDAQQVAEAMTSIALKRYTADNVAVIVVDLRRDKKPAAGKAGGGGGGGGLFGGLFGGR